jgi:serine/threonine protein kinase
MLADSLHAMVIELLTKGSLEELRKRSADGRIREFECVRMASHILSALSFTHCRDVIHRDIKPSNIMLTVG